MKLRPSAISARLLALSIFVTFSLTLYLYNKQTLSFKLPAFATFKPEKRPTCSPSDWANGTWRRKPSVAVQPPITNASAALALSGFEGCASDREFLWHLGTDHEEQWYRFPNVSSWEWEPAAGCSVRPLVREAMVKDLVEEGGWLLLGGECHYPQRYVSAPVLFFLCLLLLGMELWSRMCICALRSHAPKLQNLLA